MLSKSACRFLGSKAYSNW